MATGPLPVDHPIYSTILLEYNKLRKLEDRPKVTKLPTLFRTFEQNRRAPQGKAQQKKRAHKATLYEVKMPKDRSLMMR